MADYDATLRDAMVKLDEVIYDACGEITVATNDVIAALYKSAQEGVDATVENADVFDAETRKLAAADAIDVTRNVEVLRAYLDLMRDQVQSHFEPFLEFVGRLAENKMKDAFMLDPSGEDIFLDPDFPSYTHEQIARMIMTDYEFNTRINSGMSIEDAIIDFVKPMADASYASGDVVQRDDVDISGLDQIV